MSFRRVNCTIALFLVLQMIVPSSILAAAVGEFTAVDGKVSQTTEGKIITPKAKSPIQLKDLIVTGDQSIAAMSFTDESTITLAPNSKFEVREFAIKDNTRTGLFSLAIGKLSADVKKFIGGSSTFEVHSPTAIAGVRGTGFEIVVAMVGTQLTTTVTCTVGVLSVSALSATGVIVSTATVVAGQTAVVTATGITVSAAAGAAAGAAAAEAGAAAGVGATAGVTAGTVAAGVAAAAAITSIVVTTAAAEAATTHHHVTTTHHTTTTHH